MTDATASFKMIRPITVVDATLTSTTVDEVPVAAYNAGTTYALDAIAGTTVGTVQSVYKSLQASNLNHTQASSPSWWQLMDIVYTAYDVGTSYALGDIVSLISGDVHLLYKSATAANLGNALTDTTKWTAWGSTNSRAMFDTTYGSQSSRFDSIVVVLNLGVLVNAMFLGNLDAASVTILQSVSGWTTTITLNAHNVLNWYDWYYEPITRVSDVASLEIPPYPASTLTVTISNTGSNAKCGLLVVGMSTIIGLTQWGVLGGIISYSGTSTDAFGNTTFLSRAKAKKLNFDVRITPGLETEVHRILTEYTDIPLVFIGSTEYGMTMVYGYLGSWQVPITNSGKNAPIEVKGLT